MVERGGNNQKAASATHLSWLAQAESPTVGSTLFLGLFGVAGTARGQGQLPSLWAPGAEVVNAALTLEKNVSYREKKHAKKHKIKSYAVMDVSVRYSLFWTS